MRRRKTKDYGRRCLAARKHSSFLHRLVRELTVLLDVCLGYSYSERLFSLFSIPMKGWMLYDSATALCRRADAFC